MKRQKLRLVVKRPEKLTARVKKESISAVASAANNGTITIKGNK